MSASFLYAQALLVIHPRSTFSLFNCTNAFDLPQGGQGVRSEETKQPVGMVFGAKV